jgi:hypothetical protein
MDNVVKGRRRQAPRIKLGIRGEQSATCFGRFTPEAGGLGTSYIGGWVDHNRSACIDNDRAPIFQPAASQ